MRWYSQARTIPERSQSFNISQNRYVAAKDTGWSDDHKRAEMREENPRYLIAFDKTATTTTTPRPVAFCYFQFTLEEDCEVPTADTPTQASYVAKSADKKRGSDELLAPEALNASSKKPRVDGDEQILEASQPEDISQPSGDDVPSNDEHHDDEEEEYEDVEDEKIPVVYWWV